MRVFEGLLLLTSFLLVIGFYKYDYRKNNAIRGLALLFPVVLGIHLVYEKARWSMAPVYLLTGIIAVMGLWGMLRKLPVETRLNRLKTKRIFQPMMLVLVITAGILANVFPVYEIPEPTGTYAIGTTSFDVIDPERKAVYSDNLNEQRKIKIQVWYPAQDTTGYKRSPWLADGEIVSSALAKDMALPSFALNQTALVMSHAYEQAPINKTLKQYPVVVISHGWTGFRNLHTDLAENLASSGYIVVGIDHTYGSEVTVFNSGDVKYLNKAALPKREVTPNFLEYGNQLVKTYAGDVSLTLNELELLNGGQRPSQFKNRLNLNQIGLLGHSTGGGADVYVALNDTRIKAVMGMDAWVEPIETTAIEKGLKIPALFLRSSAWEVGENNKNLLELIEKSSPTPTLNPIKGTTHYDFSMAYMYSPLTKYIGITGNTDGRITATVLMDKSLNFFDDYLK